MSRAKDLADLKEIRDSKSEDDSYDLEENEHGNEDLEAEKEKVNVPKGAFVIDDNESDEPKEQLEHVDLADSSLKSKLDEGASKYLENRARYEAGEITRDQLTTNEEFMAHIRGLSQLAEEHSSENNPSALMSSLISTRVSGVNPRQFNFPTSIDRRINAAGGREAFGLSQAEPEPEVPEAPEETAPDVTLEKSNPRRIRKVSPVVVAHYDPYDPESREKALAAVRDVHGDVTGEGEGRAPHVGEFLRGRTERRQMWEQPAPSDEEFRSRATEAIESLRQGRLLAEKKAKEEAAKAARKEARKANKA